MKLSDYKGEKALEVLADLLDPLSRIFADKEVVALVKANKPYIKWVQAMLKNQPKAVIEALAIIDGVPPEKYEVNLATLPAKLLSFLNDPEIKNLFQSQGQMKEEASAVSASENTEA